MRLDFTHENIFFKIVLMKLYKGVISLTLQGIWENHLILYLSHYSETVTFSGGFQHFKFTGMPTDGVRKSSPWESR